MILFVYSVVGATIRLESWRGARLEINPLPRRVRGWSMPTTAAGWLRCVWWPVLTP